MPAQNPTPEVDIQHYTLENNQATTHRKFNKEEKIEVDRTHTQETTRNHYQSSHHMEPIREEAKKYATKHLAKEHREGKKRDGIHQERDGEDGHGQKTVVFLGRWPMLPVSKQA